MYKDVWKITKKILSVVLSVALIIGVVEIAPKVKAAVTPNSEGYYEINATNRVTGQEVTLLVKVANTSLEYNGSPQCPTIVGDVLLKSTKQPITGENWYLTGAQTNASESDYFCHLNDVANYDVSDDESNAIPYRITKAKIYEIFVERSNTNVVKWNSNGSAPELSSVKVQLNGGTTIDLDPKQYEVVKADSVGKQTAKVKITDDTNFDLSVERSVSVSFTCGYDLGGSAKDGTSKYTMDLQQHDAAYDGSKKEPVVIIWDDQNQEYNYTASFFKTTYYNSEGNQVNEIKAAGTYTVSVTPAGGAHTFADNDGVYFTGEYRGTFTVGARQTKDLRIVAKDLNNNGHPVIWEGKKQKQLVYPYNEGKPVELQEYSFWDGDTEVSKDNFTISWKNTSSVGIAHMIVTPKQTSNYTGIIEVPYFITSGLTIESLTFTNWGTFAGDNISLPYRGSNQPVAPSSVTVKNRAGTTLTVGEAYNVTYAYQKDGGWFSASGADDTNLAFAGKKKVIVTGLAGYESQPQVEKEYKVAAVNMNDSEFKDKFKLTITESGPFYYNGNAHKPSYTFTFNDVAVDQNDYRAIWTNNTNAGTATLTVEGVGDNFEGTKSVTFPITPISLADASIEGSYTYNRSPIHPSVVIKGSPYGDGFEYRLTEDVDYEIVDDEGNLFVGDLPKDASDTPYTLRIRSKTTNISGQPKNLSYTIDPKDIGTENSFTLQGVNGGEIEWNGGVMEPTLRGSLEEGKDYTFSYENNHQVTPSSSSGAAVVINGKGNYTGELRLYFKILPRNLTTNRAIVSTGTAIINGDKFDITLDVIDLDRGGHALAKDSDYEVEKVEYSEDEENWSVLPSTDITGLEKAGVYRVTIKGKDDSNYTGSRVIEASFGINIAKVCRVSVGNKCRALEFNGQVQTPSAVQLLDSNNKPVPSDAYTLEYRREDGDALSENIGKVYVIATGKPEKGYYGQTAISDVVGCYYEITPAKWINKNGSPMYQVTVDTKGGITYSPYRTEEPVVKVQYHLNGTWIDLVADEDYTATIADSQTAGTKWISIVGTGNYEPVSVNPKGFKYEVSPLSLNDSKISVTFADKNLSFADGKPPIIVEYDNYYELVPSANRVDNDYSYNVSGGGITVSGNVCQITYQIRGYGNYCDTIERTLTVDRTNLDSVTFLETSQNPGEGEFYVVWDESELLILSAASGVQLRPEKFSLKYNPIGGGNPITLIKDTDYKITGYGTNNAPGTKDGANHVKIQGIGGYMGTTEIVCKLYLDIDKATTLKGDLVSGSAVSAEKFWAAYPDNLKSLVTLEITDKNGVLTTVPEECYDVELDGTRVNDYGLQTVKIIGNKTESGEFCFSSIKRTTIETTGDLSDATVIVNGGRDVPFLGVPVTQPGILVQIGTRRLVEGKDYTVGEFANNDTIGEASVTIEGLGLYRGTGTTGKFNIVCNLSDAKILMANEENILTDISSAGAIFSYPYSNMGVTPQVEVYLPNGVMLTKDGNYEVAYEKDKSAGTAKVKLTAVVGSYIRGNRDITYYIRKTDISVTDGAISFDYNGRVTYTGNPITADDGLNLKIQDSNCLGEGTPYYLVEGTDFDIAYEANNHTNVTAISRVTITGKGNYVGSYAFDFEIVPEDINSGNVEQLVSELVYNGEPVEQELIEKLKLTHKTSGKQLVYATDYTIDGYYSDQNCNYSIEMPKDQGTYYVKLSGDGNFTGRRVIEFKIGKRQMDQGLRIVFKSAPDSDCTIVAGKPDCTYNSKEHKPAFDVFFGTNSEPLDPGDYKVTYSENKNAGEATVTVTAEESSNYTGSVTESFTIKQKDITESVTGSAMHFSPIAENYPFTGDSVEPGDAASMTITQALTDEDLTLVKDTDYTVTYLSEYDELERANNAPLHSYAGKVTMTVTGIGNYTGEKKIDFYIGEDISQAYATLINSSTTYNGLKQGPKEEEITVKTDGNVGLTDPDTGEKRYNIAYYKNGIEKENEVALEEIVDAATYYVAVIGIPSKGTYAKTPADDCTYTINPKTIANCNVSGFEGMYYYTGSEICPRGIVVTDTLLPVDESNRNDTRSVQLTAGIDYTVGYTNNISAGKATIVVSGMGNYSGNVYGYFTIDGSNVSGNQNHDGTSEGTGSLSSGTTTISAEDIELYYDNSQYNYMLYNGGHRVPSIRVAGGTINANNFIVTASNDINPGVATLTITGNGNNYTGTIIKNYVIKANLATHGRIVRIEDQVYTGSYVTPNITVTCGNSVLIPGRDYQATYANNVNVGTATVQAQGLASSYYFGTATGTFNISNQAGGMQITGYASNYTYTGYAITPEVIVTMDGRLLNRGTDYQVYYSNNINVGNATMTVTGIGSYSGTKVIPFTIQAKNIENCLTTTVNNYSYNGSTYTPNITVTDSTNGKTLVAGTDYTVTYSNNTDPGTASITVTALSKNYTGSKVIPFKIKSAAVSGLRTSTIKNNSIKLAWTAQSYADGYQICNSNNRVIAMTSKNKYTVKNLKSYTTYKYKVRSYVENSDGSVSYGNFSSAVSAKTLLNTPTLSAKSNSRGKVTLTWSKVSKATGYEIYYSTKRDGIYTKLKTVSKKSARKFVDAGLASGEKYYYTIRAYRKNNGVKTYSSYNTIRAVRVK